MSSPKSPGFISRHDCCGSSAVSFFHATTLTSHNKYLIMIAFGAACHNNAQGCQQRESDLGCLDALPTMSQVVSVEEAGRGSTLDIVNGSEHNS